MDKKIKQISDLLTSAGKTHHAVYKIVDGDEDDWATWYSDWLTNLTILPEVLGVKPVRSELTYLLVKLDKEYREKKPTETWQEYYAKKIIEYFGQ